MKKSNQAIAAGIVILASLTQLPAQAQSYGARSNDPWGWSQQSNEKGLREACRSSKQRYNTLVSMYNNNYRYSKSKQVREAWRADIEDARRDMQRWCRG